MTSLSGASSVTEGSPYTLTLGDTNDPGQDTIVEWIVHWGDNTSDMYSSGPEDAYIH